MIDNFALGLTHGLMLLAAWRMLSRPDFDDPQADVPPAAGADRAGRRRGRVGEQDMPGA